MTPGDRRVGVASSPSHLSSFSHLLGSIFCLLPFHSNSLNHLVNNDRSRGTPRIWGSCKILDGCYDFGDRGPQEPPYLSIRHNSAFLSHAHGRLNQTWCFPSMPRVSFYYPLNNAFPLSRWVLVRATETDICNQGTRFCPLGAESRSAFTFRRWYGYLFLRCVALILNYFLGNIRGPLSPLITRKKI